MNKIFRSAMLMSILMLPFSATASSDNPEIRDAVFGLKLQALQITDQLNAKADGYTGVCKAAHDKFEFWLLQFRSYASSIGTSSYDAEDTTWYLDEAKNIAADLEHYSCIDSSQQSVITSQLAELRVALDALSNKYQ